MKMSSAVRRERKQRSWRSLLVFIVFSYLVFTFARFGFILLQANLQIKLYEEKKAALMAEKARLEKKIQELNDDKYIERIAREELGLVKPGETIIIPAVPGQVKPYVPPKPGYKFGD